MLEDDAADAELVQNEIRRAGFDADFEHVRTERDFAHRLESDFDLILADYHLPAFDGMRALAMVRTKRDTPFILVTGTIQDHEAVEAIRGGADDYLLKDRLARLGPAIRRAFEARRPSGSPRSGHECPELLRCLDGGRNLDLLMTRDVFFYGLFMDENVLRARGVRPVRPRRGIVANYRLRIGQRALLVPESGGCGLWDGPRLD